MGTRTGDSAAPRTPRAGQPEGLRERKKRLMRRRLSDTATEMFLERGFEAVRVSEIAEACGVSEKTVFNYFPTKESLILDRSDATIAALRAALDEPGVSPVEAALRTLSNELRGMTSALAAHDDPVAAAARIRRFGDLLRASPSLRAHGHDMRDRLADVAATAMAARTGTSPDHPEPRIAAAVLLGLWHIHYLSLRKHLDGTHTPTQIHDAVTADLHRAARLVDSGVAGFGTTARN
jgi:AcrR family transcriptional regulator